MGYGFQTEQKECGRSVHLSNMMKKLTISLKPYNMSLIKDFTSQIKMRCAKNVEYESSKIHSNRIILRIIHLLRLTFHQNRISSHRKNQCNVKNEKKIHYEVINFTQQILLLLNALLLLWVWYICINWHA